MSNRGERNAVISGVGQSQIGRRIYRDPLDLTIEATFAAIDDAGLTVKDIDGISTYPGNMSVPPGFSGVGVTEVQDALRLELDWFSGGLESPGQLGSVINAIAAVATGLCRHVALLPHRVGGIGPGRPGPGVGHGRRRVAVAATGPTASCSGRCRSAPPSAANWIAMMAQRHFHEFGTTREQLAQIALNARANAALNPKAIYRDPMTMDDYLNVRMVSTPLCLYDCDVPADGGTVGDRLARRTPPATCASRRSGSRPWARRCTAARPGTSSTTSPPWRLATPRTMMWERTDLTPADVDVAELYDGFSFITLCWLEALGFCGHGEGGPFIEGGQRIARDGELPLNTHGGQLSAGRLHGYGFLHEACIQLWGEAGERQVAGDPEVAVAAAGGGPLAASLVLTRS